MALDFPSGPTIGQSYSGYVWDGEKWLSQGATPNAVRYDLPQGLTLNQMAQARANIAVMKKNYIINGGMQISQENGATAGNGNMFYPADQWFLLFNVTGAGAVTTAYYTEPTPSGAGSEIYVSCTTAQPAIGTGYVGFTQRIEGYRVADLNWGTASAKTVTVSFAVRVTNAGTYSVQITNFDGSSSAITTYSIAAGEAGAYQQRSVTFTGITTGTWKKDGTIGMVVNFFAALAGQTANVLAATGNQFVLTDVSLTEGSVAPPFMVPDYPSELALCQRYFNAVPANAFFQVSATVNSMILTLWYPTMRSNPTIGSLPWTDANYIVNTPTTGNQWTLQVPGVGYGSKTAGTFSVSVVGANSRSAIIQFGGVTMNMQTILLQGASGLSPPIMVNARL